MSYGARPVGAALGAIVGGLYGAELCLYLAVAIFGAQALVILLSPAVGLVRQPDMVGDGVARRCEPADRYGTKITIVMAGHVPAIHVFARREARRGCPAQGRA